MPAPPRSFLTVTDTAIRWQVPALDIASRKRALVGRFRRSKKFEWEMDRAPGRWRRRHCGGRDHPVQGVRALRTRLGIV